MLKIRVVYIHQLDENDLHKTLVVPSDDFGTKHDIQYQLEHNDDELSEDHGNIQEGDHQLGR